MKTFLAFLMVALVSSASTPHSRLHLRSNSSDLTPKQKSGYTNTFFEPFAGPNGCLPSSTNWLFDLGTSYPGGASQWGNNEFETYTNSTSNIEITAQHTLAITPRLTAAGWTSARIETQRSDFSAPPGGTLYVEARIKLGNATASRQQGIWPAFWALGSSFRGNYSNWPAASEWDFLEAVNGGDVIYSTAHCGVAPGGPCNEYNGLGSGGVPFSRGVWHVVGFMVNRTSESWLDETLNWYLDGVNIFTVSGALVGDEQTWNVLAHDDHFLLLNVAVGGNWPGQPNNLTIDGPSVGMEIDYVGVWESIQELETMKR